LGVDALRTIIAERADAWSERAGDSDLIEALCVAARAGDPLAVEPLERAGLGLGHAIASVALVVDIETVILMGGLSGASDLLIPWAQTGIRERIYSLMADRIHIVQGALGDRAGVVGAAIWAMDSGS